MTPEPPSIPDANDLAEARPLRHRLLTLRLRTRLTACLLLTAVAGYAMGFVASAGWLAAVPLFVVTMALAVAMVVASQWWVATPLESFTRVARLAATRRTTVALSALPTDRADEIGELARSLQTLARTTLRCERDATQLRRTLVQRIDQATKRATAKLEQLAYRDPLTGLGNRRFLHSELDEKVNLAIATQTRLLCVAIDVDYFKQVNDQLGHAVGDELLQLIGDLIRGSFRKDDITARQGGDEFVVVMAGAPRQRAYQATQRIRELFTQQVKSRYAGQLERLPNLSMGVAELDHVRCRTGHQLLEAADEQLYRAKENGKGNTVGLAA